MASLVVLCLFLTLFGRLYAGRFLSQSLKFNAYGVPEGDDFKFTCSVTHEDKRPEIQWYFVNTITSTRKNLTGFKNSGKDKTATVDYYKTNAILEDSGDYHCFAKVGEEEYEQKAIGVIPIYVFKKEDKPIVRTRRDRAKDGKWILTCEVYPKGSGFLSWHYDGRRVTKEEKNKFDVEIMVDKLKYETSTKGEYKCRGNCSLGGYRYYLSSSYITAASGWSYTTTQTTFFTTILFCFAAILNLG
ncbi:uncharacterized protein LOC114541166 [Dendronephthya gigantea]|uniref:uncharacterized protein LOC114541166 n=1 Tax=Dendronephthya gigantea TaxID=151771 RepID=UPI00106BC2AE|nr:uncharacterized protein LOC114541166 [Dendronephthya gigantea]